MTRRNLMKYVSPFGAGVAAALVSATASATDIDLTPLTGAVSFSNVATGLLAIAVVLMGVYVAQKGIMWIIKMVKGG